MTYYDAFGRSAEDRAALRDKANRLNAEAAANWGNPVWRNEIAAAITDTIYEGFEHENLLDLMSTVERVGFTDRVFVKEVRGLRAFWIARGGYIETSELKQQVVEMQRDIVGFHVYELEDKLMSGFSETQSTLINLGMERLDATVNQRFLATLQAAVGVASDYYITESGLSLGTLNTALRNVRDESKDFNVAIVGRSTMVDQIMDELLGASLNGGGFLPESNQQMIQRGIMGTYRGARIIKLTNHKDDVDTSFFPANEMWVLGRDASKIAFYGGLRSKQWVEDEVDYWHYRAQMEMGVIVHHPERTRRIIDSSQDA